MIERVNRVWKKPNKKDLKKWWKLFSDFNIHDYDYYLVGGFINKKQTKDIDIAVQGPIDNKLSVILTLAKMIGEKYNILIDIFWVDKMYDFDNYQPTKRIRNFNKLKITRNNKTKVYDYGGVEVLDGLFMSDYKNPYRDYYKGIDYKNKYIKIQDYINGTTDRNSLL